MAITPQAIKDQEFQTKFRGYDTVEVKAYLDLIAEEFFELLEKLRQHEESRTELERQHELAEEGTTQLENDLEASRRTVEELRATLAEKDSKEQELLKELEELQTAQADFDQERKEYEEEISEVEARVSDRDEQLRKQRSEMDALANKIALLEEQIRELKTEEVDFKRTIGVAQRFADDLMEKTKIETQSLVRDSEVRAQGLIRASEEKSSRALKAASEEIERLRQEAYEELSRLPEEIEHLRRQRRQARDELEAILSRHMEELASFSAEEEDVVRYNYDELFQKIDLTDPIEQAETDVLDTISMDLPIPSLDELDDEEQDDLRRKLEEGGIAYLSDDD